MIDHDNNQKKQSHLFEYLVHILRGEEVNIEKFEYYKDPRLCFNEKYPDGVDLSVLQTKYSDYDLIIFGKASSFISGRTRELTNWATNDFKIWENKALIINETVKNWAYEEFKIYDLLTILPSNIEALFELIKELTNTEKKSFKSLVKYYYVLTKKEQYNFKNIENFKQIFFSDMDMFLWIISLSVHQKINWEIILAIGKALENHQIIKEKSLSYANLLKLMKINFLKKSAFDEKWRLDLYGLLKEHKNTEEIARKAVIELYQNTNLPKNSFAHLQKEIQIDTQNLYLEPDNKKYQDKFNLLKQEGLIEEIEYMIVDIDRKYIRKRNIKTIKIFLASSSELKEERKEFEIFINRKNNILQKRDVFLKLIIWEDFIDAMAQKRLQDEYNKVISECDIFVSLFFTKVGRYTNEEFETAFKSFHESGKPLIYTYFKNSNIKTEEITDEFITLLNFKKHLEKLNHFYTKYENTEGLLKHFGDQLEKILPRKYENFKEIITENKTIFLNNFAKIEKKYFVGSETELKYIDENLSKKNEPLVLLNGLGGIGKTTLAQAYINRFQNNYNNILWVSVFSDLQNDFKNEFQMTKFGIENLEKKDNQFKRILNKLNYISGNNLLILDNANDKKDLQENYFQLQSLNNWKVLMTSRAKIDNINILEIEHLDLESAKKLFEKHFLKKIAKNEEKNFLELLKHIDYHTLMIELIAKAGNKKSLEIAEILQILKVSDFKDDKLQRKIGIGLHAEMTNKEKECKMKDYILSLFNFEQLTDEEKKILRYFSILPNDFIEIEKLKAFFQIKDENDFEHTIENLVSSGYLQTTENSYKCHAVLQQITFEKLNSNPKNCIVLIRYFIDILDTDPYKNKLDFVKYLIYAENIVLIFYKEFEKNNKIENIKEIATLSNNLASVLHAKGDYKKTLEYNKKAISIYKKNLDKNHPSLANAYNDIASTYQNLGDNEKELEYNKKALKIKEKVYPLIIVW